MAENIDKFYFKSELHRQIFERGLYETGQLQFSSDYWTAIYVLASMEKEDVLESMRPSSIAFDQIREGMSYLSSAERGIVNLANNFFNGYQESNFYYDTAPLDEKNSKVILCAVRMLLKV